MVYHALITSNLYSAILSARGLLPPDKLGEFIQMAWVLFRAYISVIESRAVFCFLLDLTDQPNHTLTDKVEQL